MSAEMPFDDTIDAISTIALFEQIERANRLAKRITIIYLYARYYRAKAVAEYLQNSRINLLFLPPFSPNLNLIDRFWKFFKRQVLYNRYYEDFKDRAGFGQRNWPSNWSTTLLIRKRVGENWIS